MRMIIIMLRISRSVNLHEITLQTDWLGIHWIVLYKVFLCFVFFCFFVIFIFYRHLQTILNNYTTRQNLYKVRSDRKSTVQGSPTSVFFFLFICVERKSDLCSFFFQLKYTIPLLGYIRILFCTSYCFRDMN